MHEDGRLASVSQQQPVIARLSQRCAKEDPIQLDGVIRPLSPAFLTPKAVRRLQMTAGNRATVQLMKSSDEGAKEAAEDIGLGGLFAPPGDEQTQGHTDIAGNDYTGRPEASPPPAASPTTTEHDERARAWDLQNLPDPEKADKFFSDPKNWRKPDMESWIVYRGTGKNVTHKTAPSDITIEGTFDRKVSSFIDHIRTSTTPNGLISTTLGKTIAHEFGESSGKPYYAVYEITLTPEMEFIDVGHVSAPLGLKIYPQQEVLILGVGKLPQQAITKIEIFKSGNREKPIEVLHSKR